MKNKKKIRRLKKRIERLELKCAVMSVTLSALYENENPYDPPSAKWIQCEDEPVSVVSVFPTDRSWDSIPKENETIS